MDRVIGWSTVAVVTAVTALLLTVMQVSSCADAAPGGGGASSCTTQPLIGVAGSWIAGVVGAAVVAASVWQMVRATRSGEQHEG